MTTALDRLAELVGVSDPPALSEDDLNMALAGAIVPDAEGRLPGDPDWEPTYDLEWAAGIAFDLKAAYYLRDNPQDVLSFTSENSTFQLGPTRYKELADLWYRRSRIIGPLTGYGTLSVDLRLPSLPPRSGDHLVSREALQEVGL